MRTQLPMWYKEERNPGEYDVTTGENGEDIFFTTDEDQADIAASAPEMFNAINQFSPHGQDNLADEIWSALRRHGEHRLAERLTTATNEMRAAISTLTRK